MINLVAMISPMRIQSPKPCQKIRKQKQPLPPKKKLPKEDKKKLSPHRNYITYNKKMKIKEGLKNASFDMFA